MSRLLALALPICIYMFAAPACLGQQGANPAAAGPPQAQEPTASGIIRGTVTDPQGAVVASAFIKVTDIQTGAIFTGKSDDQGKFSLADLPFGDYAVDVSAPGFSAYRITVSLGKDNSSAPHSAQLQVG